MDAEAAVVALAALQQQVASMNKLHAAEVSAHALELEQLAAAVNRQDEQIAAAVAARGAHATGPRQVRITPPPQYDGSRPPIDVWTASMKQSFTYNRLITDADQVGLAAACITGPALDWYNNAVLLAQTPPTWVEFEAGLRLRFQPVTTADIARGRMDNLRQGKRPVVEYVAAFRRLVVALPSTDAGTLLFNFQRGLSHELQLINLQHHPVTLEAAIDLAVRTGSTYYTGGGAAGSAAPMELNALYEDAYYDGSAPAASRPHSPSEAMLMERLTAMFSRDGDGRSRAAHGAGAGERRSLPRIQGLTPEQVKAYMDEGKCFGCGSKQHMSHGCPRRTVVDGKVSWPAQKN